ncbi:hypothetical protein L210DRAFT_3522341 [Boletus edulis BED1]|uniref:Uncharacterized protein n=1 Tax=Boletus edulis BED1 TaxID=1328754 RepID=A0AAD4BK89_BOLED|nr:hypothetical protein L210DRAFT_3558086 [Boletus edulis BED1]KAF8451089.1 hypothetical protein L210DRAFT_3522341 [Boletus edulis BED1]
MTRSRALGPARCPPRQQPIHQVNQIVLKLCTLATEHDAKKAGSEVARSKARC